jgi:hypothetical protein
VGGGNEIVVVFPVLQPRRLWILRGVSGFRNIRDRRGRPDFGFDAEFFVVAVAIDFILADSDENHAGGGVNFGV